MQQGGLAGRVLLEEQIRMMAEVTEGLLASCVCVSSAGWSGRADLVLLFREQRLCQSQTGLG